MFFSLVSRILSVILLAGATLCLIFIVLSGSINSFPFDEFYWVQADTSKIPAAGGDVTRWTYWGICHPDAYDASNNGNCSSLGPDKPLSPYDNFGNSTSLPQDFVENRDTYYYLSRFSFPLLLIALFFSGISFLAQLIVPCWGSMRHVTVLFVTIGLILVLAGAATETAVSVLTKQKFKDAGYSAKLGSSMMGLLWASVACLLIVFFLTCCNSLRRAYITHRDLAANEKALELNQINQQPVEAQPDLAPAQSQLAAAPLATQGAQAPLSPSETAEDYGQSQGALPSNEGGIRFFKIKRTSKNGDEESL
ncbi:DEKNAAC101986 [Brettanomyces naardenensis]|uniref:DEKNAAC101986 n=1 Tax=Brettanomyces naardenensis TaxID=13370 RepID=A0A448YJE9_BRENA|nr:DEKNAAC101986 [Brettanomyces naardenensis]